MNAIEIIGRTEREILDIVRRHPGVARSGLTQFTRVTQQSVHRMVDTLAGRGLVRLTDGVVSGRGKPSPGVHLVADARYAAGVLVNTDSILLSLADLSCREVAHCVVDSDPTDRVTALAETAAALDAMLDAMKINRARLVGLGFSMSGFKSGLPGHFVAPVPLTDWSNRDLRGDVQVAFGLPVWLENNGTAAAVGEAMVGAGLAHDTFAYLSFNYGFGGGIVNRGLALQGGFGNAGEMSAVFTPDQMPHRPALGELMKRLRASGETITTVSEFVRRYDPAWPAIARWLDEVSPQLNQVIRALNATVNPTAIVFGGEAPLDLRVRLIAICDPSTLDRYGAPIPGPELLLSATETDPATFGAALIPLKDCLLI